MPHQRRIRHAKHLLHDACSSLRGCFGFVVVGFFLLLFAFQFCVYILYLPVPSWF